MIRQIKKIQPVGNTRDSRVEEILESSFIIFLNPSRSFGGDVWIEEVHSTHTQEEQEMELWGEIIFRE